MEFQLVISKLDVNANVQNISLELYARQLFNANKLI